MSFIYYRQLNAVAVRDYFQLVKMDECINTSGGTSNLTILDAYSSYRQFKINEHDRENKDYTVHRGLYQFVRMRCELENEFATFHRAMVAV